MQTMTQIRELLSRSGLSPRKQYGQNFLVDGNLMQALLDLAEVQKDQTVLEVGPGTGSLTEELLDRAGKVVAVEIDYGFSALLHRRLSDRPNLELLEGDVLSGKHAIRQDVLTALEPEARLVSNLPYNIATPLVSLCLVEAWRACVGGGSCFFDRATFTVQREVADRFAAAPGGKDYGPVSVVVSLLGRITAGPVVPAQAFWPQPKVSSRILRIDFDRDAAARVADIDVLLSLVSQAFTHRRKQLGWLCRHAEPPFEGAALARALETAGIAETERAERVSPQQYRTAANRLARPI